MKEPRRNISNFNCNIKKIDEGRSWTQQGVKKSNGGYPK